MQRVRIGYGYDVHRLEGGRRLVLGGVHLPADVGLEGHSDADVLTHAIIDALLGAAALGDIGQHFPDTDPRWKDAESLALLRHVSALVAGRGWRVANIDATVVLQRPRLAPHISEMRANLAACLGLGVEAISIKATTGEHVGFVGRGEGAVAHAVCLLVAHPS